MRTITVHKKELDYAGYKNRSALESDYSRLFKDDVRLIDDTGKLVAVYFVLGDSPEFGSLLRAVRSLRYPYMGRSKNPSNVRASGLKSVSRIFGYRPRDKIRNNFCSSTGMAQEEPKQHAVICGFASFLDKYYRSVCGDVYKTHLNIAEDKILPEWRIESTPFTSGIVNWNSALKYHFDTGNFEGVYSNMVALKHNVSGGYLALPEYDVGLEIANRSVLLFDGQKILHGVTPIKYHGGSYKYRHQNTAYRYSLVYYTLKQMWNCEPFGAELDRIRQDRQEVEMKRYRRLKEGSHEL